MALDLLLDPPPASGVVVDAPENTVAPAVTGSPIRGSTLTCGTGTWTGDGITYAYAWYVDGALNAGLGTASTADTTGLAYGSLVKGKVTASNAGGSASAFSNEVEITRAAPTNTAVPTIGGDPYYELHSTSDGTWTGDDITLTYAWYVDDVLDAGLGSADDMVVVPAHATKALKLKVTATNSGGSASAYSAATTIPWMPSLLSNLLVWLDGDYAAGMTLVSGKISQWNDRSANGYHVSQGTDANRPTLTANGLNSRDVASGAFGSWMTSAASLAHSGAWSSGFVAKATGVASHAIFQIGSVNDAGCVFASTNWTARPRGTGGATVGWTTDVVETITTTVTTTRTEIYKDGTVGTGADLTAISASSKTLTIFALNSTTYKMQGFIAELVLTAATLGTTDRQKLEGYLAHKWAQTGDLPGDHPYKSTRP